MIYSSEVQRMCPVAKGAYHGPAPIPEEGKWVQAKEIKDISAEEFYPDEHPQILEREVGYIFPLMEVEPTICIELKNEEDEG